MLFKDLLLQILLKVVQKALLVKIGRDHLTSLDTVLVDMDVRLSFGLDVGYVN